MATHIPSGLLEKYGIARLLANLGPTSAHQLLLGLRWQLFDLNREFHLSLSSVKRVSRARKLGHGNGFTGLSDYSSFELGRRTELSERSDQLVQSIVGVSPTDCRGGNAFESSEPPHPRY